MRPRACAWLVPLALLLGSSSGFAAEVKLAWDPTTTNLDGTPVTDLSGYKVYYGTAPDTFDAKLAKEGPSPVDVPVAVLVDPKQPTASLSGLPSCTHFYFAVTAYSPGGESDFSNKVDKVIAYKPKVTLAISGGKVVATWTGMPADDTGQIKGYRVHYDTDQTGEPYQGKGATQGSSPLDVPAGTTTLELGGLTAGTIYLAVETTCSDGGKLSDEVSLPLKAGATSGPGDDDEAGGPSTLIGGCQMAPAADGASASLLLLALALLARRRRAC